MKRCYIGPQENVDEIVESFLRKLKICSQLHSIQNYIFNSIIFKISNITFLSAKLIFNFAFYLEKKKTQNVLTICALKIKYNVEMNGTMKAICVTCIIIICITNMLKAL